MPCRTASRVIRCLIGTLIVTLAMSALADEPFEVRTLPGNHHLENVFRLDERVWSGSEPTDEADFQALAAAGITTIISVDSVAPHLEAARRHGIRYVHVPIGYDQVDPQSQLMLARVAREIDGTIYVHCHHGKHRGPAAAAALCRLSGTFTPQTALQYLEAAGTGKQYIGLWRSVEQLQAPAADVPLPELVEVSPTEPFAAAMGRLDQTLRRFQELAQQELPAQDEARRTSATLLLEGLIESRRVLARDAAPALTEEFQKAIDQAQSLVEATQALESSEAATRSKAIEQWRSHARALERRCIACHENHRDR